MQRFRNYITIFLVIVSTIFLTDVKGHRQRSYPSNPDRRSFVYIGRRGDMRTFQARIWDVSKPIPYQFNGSYTSQEKQNFLLAAQEWASGTCIRLTEVPWDPRRRSCIIIEAGTRDTVATTGPQDQQTLVTVIKATKVFLDNIQNIRGLAHEFGHALGLMHEHERTDRTVHVLLDQINPLDQNQYALMNGDEDGTPYDLASIMHYTGDSMPANGDKMTLTMIAQDPDDEDALGASKTPDFNDLKIINLHYKCAEVMCGSRSLPQSCQNFGYQDPNNCRQCACPDGVGGPYCTQVAPSKGFDTLYGGVINMQPCQSTTLTLPTYPGQYPFDASCTWVINSRACNLEIAFEEQPDMSDLSGGAHTCQDYLEIRTDFTHLDVPGKFFCTHSSVQGRTILVQGGIAMLHFHSSNDLRDRDTRGKGFKVVVHTTCSKSPISSPETGCKITQSGFDVNGARLPFCGGVQPISMSVLGGGPLPAPGTSCTNGRLAKRQENTYKRLFKDRKRRYD